MNKQTPTGLFRGLTAYYALLQASHLIFLARAGLIWSSTRRIPFPAPPPPAGWQTETIPFLFGMGAIDALAALLGIYFAADFLLFSRRNPFRIGLVSTTIALTSAFIFAVGTISSGAWSHSPLLYSLLVLFFAPAGALFLYLLKETNKQ